jgi:predicted MFS family arabinose efflux permease
MNTDKKDPMDGEYIGNLFGWRISIIGIFVIGSLLLLAFGRAWYLDVPMSYVDPDLPPTEQVDSTMVE